MSQLRLVSAAGLQANLPRTWTVGRPGVLCCFNLGGAAATGVNARTLDMETVSSQPPGDVKLGSTTLPWEECTVRGAWGEKAVRTVDEQALLAQALSKSPDERKDGGHLRLQRNIPYFALVRLWAEEVAADCVHRSPQKLKGKHARKKKKR